MTVQYALISPSFFAKCMAENARAPVRISAGIEHKIFEWRRVKHQNPELSHREFRT